MNGKKYKATTPDGNELVMRELGAMETHEISQQVAVGAVGQAESAMAQVGAALREQVELVSRSIVRYGSARASEACPGEQIFLGMSARDRSAAELLYQRIHTLTKKEQDVFFSTIEPVTEG